MPTPGSQALTVLQDLWQREATTARERLRAERDALPLHERVARGLAGTDLRLGEASPVPGGRVAVTLTSGRPGSLAGLRLGPGDPVLLWRHRPDEPEAVRRVLGRRRGDEAQVVVTDEDAEALELPGFRLDRDAPDVTTARGQAALERAIQAQATSDLGRMREVLWGDAPIHREAVPDLPCFDAALHEAQQRAVQHAARARPVALVHGPPGTGKTRVLVEVVRQAVARGERVLCTAASHAAVDHLVEQLARAGLDVLRIGHPARLAEATAGLGLDARLEGSDVWALARQWSAQARALFRKLDAKRARGTLGRDEAGTLRQEAKGYLRDARKQLDLKRKTLVASARIVAVTAAGADVSALRGERFDVAVVDEATQCVDPLLLIPLGMATRAVLAGDPLQLPPTVVDEEAARLGLGTTAFERLARRDDHAAVLLVRQHRMHADIMAFPSARCYGGKLVAAAEVAHWRLEDLPGVRADPTRDRPLVLIDAAGAGWQEERDSAVAGQRGSVANPEAALRVVREVERLVSRGVPPEAIAVLTPYDAQRRLLTGRLGELRARGLEVDTIDAFQGRERPAVVVDLVRSNDAGEVGFLADTRRLNVALTRAQRLLLIVGDSATVGQHPFYAALLEAIEARGRWLSVFEDDAEALDPQGSG
jgi:ATP-dependent RNA/DNA helicase IGHMBP2